MSLVLLAPLGIAAFVAAVVPLAIHLIRRPDLVPVEFAALRWIAQRRRPQRRLRLERPWLLLIRVALLAALALLLAQPAWMEAEETQATRAFVAPGIDRAAVRAALDGREVDLRWLAPGFPAFDTPAPGPVPFASLLREADALAPSGPMIVLVPSELAGLDGERIRLSHALDWIVLPGAMPSGPAPTPVPLRFSVRHRGDVPGDIAWLRAAVAAWNADGAATVTLDEGNLDTPLPVDARWLAWLSPTLPPSVERWINDGGHALLVEQDDAQGDALWRDDRGEVVARSMTRGRGRVVTLRGALDPAALPQLFDADFPRQLQAALDGPAPAPVRAAAGAVTPMRAAVGADSAPDPRTPHPLDRRCVLLVAALFLLERITAVRRRAVAA